MMLLQMLGLLRLQGAGERMRMRQRPVVLLLVAGCSGWRAVLTPGHLHRHDNGRHIILPRGAAPETHLLWQSAVLAQMQVLAVSKDCSRGSWV